jgi:hypothetical protein
MRRFQGFVMASAALCLASCSPPVSAIGPIFVYPPPEFGRTCEELAIARTRLTQRLIFVNLYQDTLYRADQTTTLGIPTPLGTPFEESREFELGVLKGELVQIDGRLRESRCAVSK